MVNITTSKPPPSFKPLSSNPLTQSLLPPQLVCSGLMQPYHHSQYLSKIISLQKNQRPDLLTLSKAFLRYKCRASGPSPSSNILSDTSTLLLPSSTSSCIFTITCTTSGVDLPFLKPAWFSSSIPIFSAHIPNLIATTLAKILLPVANGQIPLWLSTSPFALFLNNDTIILTLSDSSHFSARLSIIVWTILTILSTLSLPS